MSVITNYITSFNKLVRKLFIYLFEVKLNEKKIITHFLVSSYLYYIVS